ncbi:hypothetical protein V5799_010969 [Amblyomma americanum]|uniref:Uncharacterized protein n=1 Tax=Amblyomma americanum TaxID=6943 RepID=A0AAQ4EIM5_AMBAM
MHSRTCKPQDSLSDDIFKSASRPFRCALSSGCTFPSHPDDNKKRRAWRNTGNRREHDAANQRHFVLASHRRCVSPKPPPNLLTPFAYRSYAVALTAKKAISSKTPER